ncbi:MAG: hypothetical protein KBC34_05620 [Phenylobacterium sp.]|nr:hypothetical protein [Phenylobacterium sp.]
MLIAPIDLTSDPRPFYQALANAVAALQTPQAPAAVFACARADVPPAANWPNGVLRVSDLDILAVSNGSAWIRQDTGAPI